MPDPVIRCARVTDVGAYLLGGLTAADAGEFRRHADTCEWCATEVRALRPVVDRLADTDLSALTGAPRPEPSPDVRARLLSVAAADPGFSAAPSHDAPRSSGRAAARWRRALALGAAAAVVFALGIGSTLGVQRATHKRTNQSSATSWNAGQDHAESVRFASVNATPAPDQTSRAWAHVSSGKAGTYAALYTLGMTPGETYRWWFIKRDGSRVGLGSFVFPVDQRTWLVCPGSTSVERAELVAIGATDSKGVDVLRTELPNVPA